jgi:hypothetical protein
MLSQIPEIDKATELRAETFKGGFVWAVNFKLPQPAEQDGYIIQKIQQIENGTIHKLEKKADGSTELVKSQVSREIYYWEVRSRQCRDLHHQRLCGLLSFGFNLGFYCRESSNRSRTIKIYNFHTSILEQTSGAFQRINFSLQFYG